MSAIEDHSSGDRPAARRARRARALAARGSSRHQLREGVRGGRLRPGTALPSSRALAAELGRLARRGGRGLRPARRRGLPDRARAARRRASRRSRPRSPRRTPPPERRPPRDPVRLPRRDAGPLRVPAAGVAGRRAPRARARRPTPRSATATARAERRCAPRSPAYLGRSRGVAADRRAGRGDRGDHAGRRARRARRCARAASARRRRAPGLPPAPRRARPRRARGGRGAASTPTGCRVDALGARRRRRARHARAPDADRRAARPAAAHRAARVGGRRATRSCSRTTTTASTATTASRSARCRASRPSASSTSARPARRSRPALRLAWLALPAELVEPGPRGQAVGRRRLARRIDPARARRLRRPRRARPPRAPHARELPPPPRHAGRGGRRATCRGTRVERRRRGPARARDAAAGRRPRDRCSRRRGPTASRCSATSTPARPTCCSASRSLPEPSVEPGRSRALARRAIRSRVTPRGASPPERESARGGTRTHTPSRAAVLKTAASGQFRHPGAAASANGPLPWNTEQLRGPPRVPIADRPSAHTHAWKSQPSSTPAPPASTAARRCCGCSRDERLVALIRRGNHHAFEALVARYQSRLLAFCRHMLASARGRGGRAAGGVRGGVQRDAGRRARDQRAAVAVPDRAQPLAQPPAPHAGGRASTRWTSTCPRAG